MASPADLAAEQDYFDRAADFRERKRHDLMAAPASAAGPRAGAAAVRRAVERTLETIAGPDEPVAFGRIDTDDETLYIGKHLITDDDREPVVINWQLPVAERFYRATFQDPLGVRIKRQYKTEGSKVIDFDEIVLADLADRVEQLTTVEQLGIDDTVLTELNADRTGEMQDIVQTIHASQYELIRAPLEQLLLVQGGPGTGKTVVALHRVSWLLFNYRDILSPDRVLVIGPNATFTRYISSVLPGLGDREVIHQNLRGLGPQISDGRAEDVETTRLKGEARMARLLARGLRQRVRIADQSATFDVGGRGGAQLDRARVETALANAVSATSYNVGRAQFRNWLETRARAAARQPEAITASAIDTALERAWPSLTAPAFLRELLGSRDRLVAAAGDDFTAGDIARLGRPSAERLSEERWSDADVALLDEADSLIRGRRETFLHIVVDEAQDLSPMQLRSIKRRSLRGSMTVVGDLAQATGPWARDTWDDILDGLAVDEPCVREELLLGYRVPEQVYSFAAKLLPYIAPSLQAPRVVRRGPSDPALVEVERDDLASAAITAARDHAGRGLFVGVICPETLRSDVIDGLKRQGVQFADARAGKLGSSINVADPDEAKGLEFDAVVVVGPDLIASDSSLGLRRLYVALTRTTRYLTVVHTGVALPLPSGDDASGSSQDEGLDGDIDRPVVDMDAAMRPTAKVTDLVVATVAKALADELRASAASSLWSAILDQLRSELEE